MKQNHKVVELRGGLTEKQYTFAKLWAAGFSKSEAYRQAYDTEECQNKTVWVEACKLSQNPKVAMMADKMVKEAHISALDCVQRYHRDLQDLTERAIEDDNLNAAASFMRLRGQAMGYLKDVQVDGGPQVSDEQLIQSIAGEDKHKAKALRRIIGADSFEEMEQKLKVAK